MSALCIGLVCGAMSLDTPQRSWGQTVAQLVSGPIVAAQLKPGATEGERAREAARLLGEARKAMKAGDLVAAERLIEQAESLKVTYDPLTAPFQYTPERARQELEQYRQRAAMNGSSRRASPAAAAQPPTTMPVDPFAARRGQPDVAQPAEHANQWTPDEDTQSNLPPSAPSPAQPLNALLAGGPNRNADRSHAAQDEAGATATDGVALLWQARRALAAGDLQAASRFVAQARQAGATASPNGDSPERVEALMRRIAATSNGRSASPEDTVRLLTEQADWLLQYGDIELAQQLARQAAGIDAQLNPFERSPADVLQDIARQRQAAGRSESPAAPDRTMPSQKAEALRLLAEAQLAMDRNDLSTARRLVQQAVELRVPDSQFGANETRPWELLLKLDHLTRHWSGQHAAGEVRPADYQADARTAEPVVPAEAIEEPSPARQTTEGERLYQLGIQALEKRDPQAALEHFRKAWTRRDQLDEATRQSLQDKLNLLQGNAVAAAQPQTPLDQVAQERQLELQKLQQEVFRERAAAENLKAKDPRAALAQLQALRKRVDQAHVDATQKTHLLAVIDRSILDMQRYIEQNIAQIENDEQNRARLAEVEARRQRRVEVDNKLAQLVDDFNKLMDENRFAEAEVLARQARELDPDNPVVQNLLWKSRFARRLQAQLALQEEKEENFWAAMQSVEEASRPFDDRFPLRFDATNWKELSKTRREWLRQQQGRLSPTEQKIQQALETEKISARFIDRPLREVMDVLEATAGVNIHLDPRGLHAEGVTSDTPVTLTLSQPITLKSALNLILEPLGLSYIIQNEVIKVTSAQLKEQHVYAKTYYVADLVIPIPNFVSNYNMGFPAAMAQAYGAMASGGVVPPAGTVPLSVAPNPAAANSMIDPKVLANVGPQGLPGPVRSRPTVGQGPGGIMGGTGPDFDSLIELITTTIAPETWDDVGGPGSIMGYESNLSLVISQTQEVHEEIEDLLQQLRRIQDLQVTIEVRFITLNDDFFERIGVDFDFQIRDKTGLDPTTTTTLPEDRDLLIGLLSTDPLTATEDLDLVFNQGSFSSALPQFGGFDPATAANFGFAILSDLEVFFLLQAAQGDSRTNVMQAPKITLFNGQFGAVSDVSIRPFVTSVIPVVGDFAAAHQPVVVVLTEGTSLNVQAVVSADRRFVRLTLLPFFSTIGDVQQFTFTGKKVATSTQNVVDSNGNPTGATNTTSDIIEGTTVQQPTFSFTNVSTTVSVPDGGTVLLGGIKRMSEGRTERGVPLLSKVPYVNRLFKNVGIGREAQTLMMMVTPRIVIQEEEELEQTGVDSSKL